MSTVSPVPSSPLASASSEELRRATARSSAERADSPSTGESANEQSFSFSDFLSVINPLQHIPIVGSIYRAVTGDTIKPAARVLGGMIFGGPVGLIASAFNAVIEQTKGKDLGDQAIALFTPDKGSPTEPATQFANAASTEPPAEPAAATTAPVSSDDATPAAPPARVQLSRNAPPGLLNAFGQDRTLGNSLLRGPQNAAANATSNGATTPQGRTLSDYRHFSGRPLPVVDSTRSASSHATPVRLQPTAPMAEKFRVQPATTETVSPNEPAPGESPVSTKGETPAAGAPAPASDWFAAAMSRGLDKYREQRRQTSPGQIDTTL